MGTTNKPILIDLTKEQKANIKNAFAESKLIYKKTQKGYKIKCLYCNHQEDIDKEMMKQIQASHLCPKCFRTVELKKDNYISDIADLLKVNQDGQEIGYYVRLIRQIGKKPKFEYKQVAYWDKKDKFYCRNVLNSLSGWKYYSNKQIDRWYRSKEERDRLKKFRLRKGSPYSYQTLENCFVDYRCIRNDTYMTKKEYYERYANYELKSNQRKIVEDNLLNYKQVLALKIFNLKNYKEIYKYRAYINKYGSTIDPYDFELNIYFLDYLSRNDIHYHDFTDYIDDCIQLGLKVDKPKDFNKAHELLANEIVIKDKSKCDKKIKTRFIELKRKSLSNEHYEIAPFESVREIVEVGAKLHNCLSTYVEKYAKGQTDIYLIKKQDEVIGAIEIKNNKLIQARGKCNTNLEKEQNRFVNKWLKEVYGQRSKVLEG